MGSRDYSMAKRGNGTKPSRSLVALARQTQQARINCSQHFPKHVFRYAAWDIMLELFIVAEEGRNMCVKETMAVSGESATSTMRRIEGLEEARLVARRYDPIDHRRVIVELSENGRQAMIAFLVHLFEAGEAASEQGGTTKPVSFIPMANNRQRGLGEME